APVPPPPDLDRNTVLRELRPEVDALLEAGRMEDAERRMIEVRDELETAGHYTRVINQGYLAWYGASAARPDATEPRGGPHRETPERSSSPPAFVETIRGWTSRADVEAGLVDLGGTLEGDR